MSLPKGHSTHKKPVALGGGIAIFLAFLVGAVLLGVSREILIGATLFFGIGFLDDVASVKNVKINPLVRLSAQFLAAIFVAWNGLGVEYISSPFGGTWVLPVLLMHVLTVFWIVICVNAVNFLDGIDGLASGVVMIAAIFLAGIAIVVGSGEIIVLVAILLAVIVLPYIFFNFAPARLFMDDSGAYLLGFLVAALAMHGGGRIATAFLVLGLPLLDIAVVVLKRLHRGQKPWVGDKISHIHHILLAKNWSPRKITLTAWGVTILVGVLALFLGTVGKMVLVGVYGVALGAFSFRN